MPRGNIEPIRRFSGVDLSKDPRDLSDDQLAWTPNVYEAKPGEIATRKQTQIFGDTNNFTGKMRFSKLFSFNDAYGHHWLVFWMDDDGAGQTYVAGYEPATDTFVQFGDASCPKYGSKPTFLQWESNLLIFQGSDRMRIMTPTPAGAVGWDNSFVTGEWASNPVHSSIAEIYRDSIAIARGARIHWMDMVNLAQAYQLVPETSALDVSPNDRDNIVGLKQVAVLGGSDYIEPYMLVFKNRSTWILRGDAPTVAEAGSLVVTPLLPKVGCVAKETIVSTDKGIVWCSGDDVWIAPEGANPQPLGLQIQKRLKLAGKQNQEGWHATYFDGYYRLTIPGEGAGAGTTTAEGLTATEQWWLDLREFPERISWWGPQLLPCNASHVELSPNNDQRLIGTFFQGIGSSTTVYFVEMDVETEDHLDAHSGLEGVGPPQAMIRFKEFDFGDPMVKKVIQAIELEYMIDKADRTVQVKAIGDGGYNVKFFETESPELRPSDLSLTLDSSVLATTMSVKSYHPPNSSRFTVKTVQPELSVPTTASDQKIGKMIFKSLGLKMSPIKRRP